MFQFSNHTSCYNSNEMILNDNTIYLRECEVTNLLTHYIKIQETSSAAKLSRDHLF